MPDIPMVLVTAEVEDPGVLLDWVIYEPSVIEVSLAMPPSRTVMESFLRMIPLLVSPLETM